MAFAVISASEHVSVGVDIVPGSGAFSVYFNSCFIRLVARRKDRIATGGYQLSNKVKAPTGTHIGLTSCHKHWSWVGAWEISTACVSEMHTVSLSLWVIRKTVSAEPHGRFRD